MTPKPTTTITAAYTVRAFMQLLEQEEPVAQQATDQRSHVITRLENFLGRPALVKDLTDRTMAMYFDWLRETFPLLKVEALRDHEQRLLSLARRAAERDIIRWPLVSWHDRAAEHKQYRNNPGLAELLRYFEDHFVVDRRERGRPLKPETEKAYRAAIRAFSRFAPKLHTVKHISRLKLNQFRQWLLDRGMNAKKAGNHAFAVAAIARHACPERFLDVDGLPTKDAKIERRLAYVFEKHYLPAKQKIASKKSTDKYVAVFNSFGRHVGHVATLDDLTDENIGSYMRELRRTGRSIRTVNGYRSKLLAMWNWCAKKRMVENFPTVEKMPEPLLMPVAWTADELRKLLAGCERMPGAIEGIPAPDWWRALHYVAWDTGERTGALLAMTWNMVNVKTGQLAVPAEFRKGGKKPMLYKLKPQTMRILLAIREPERELIFPFPKNGTFYHRYKLLLRLAGLPYVRYKSALQKMRRSFATHLEAAGGDATIALAHSERAITTECYLDPRLIERTPANELLFPLEAATANQESRCDDESEMAGVDRRPLHGRDGRHGDSGL